ncbi:MAG: hypothetical protein V4625_03615 [Pseudomonadota bacterium]
MSFDTAKAPFRAGFCRWLATKSARIFSAKRERHRHEGKVLQTTVKNSARSHCGRTAPYELLSTQHENCSVLLVNF